MISLPDSDLEGFLEEDVPYGDLTTHLLGIGERPGRIVFSTREETTLCCTEEAGRVLRMCGGEVASSLPSGTTVPAGVDFLVAEGTAEALHAGWKVSLNLLEYASGIASRTRTVVEKARSADPAPAVLATRKSFPGTKKIALKAVVAGGGLPHRLGLSESVLLFKQHTAFLDGPGALAEAIALMRRRAPETKIIVEADTVEEAALLAGCGADVVQLDKVRPEGLRSALAPIRAAHPHLLLSAAGGVNEANAAQYAEAGVDILVLSSVYFGKPSDIAVRLESR